MFLCSSRPAIEARIGSTEPKEIFTCEENTFTLHGGTVNVHPDASAKFFRRDSYCPANTPATIRLAIKGDDGCDFLDPHFISLSAVHCWARQGDCLSGIIIDRAALLSDYVSIFADGGVVFIYSQQRGHLTPSRAVFRSFSPRTPLRLASSPHPLSLVPGNRRRSLRPFVSSSHRTKAQAALATDEFDDSFPVSMDDAYSPEKKPKKAASKKAATTSKATTAEKKSTAPKKPAAAKSDKPKAPAKPRAKKVSVKVQEPEPMDVDSAFDMDRSFSVLETPQEELEAPSPPRPTVLQEANADGASKKNASETYQKVSSSFNVGLMGSLRNLNTSLFDRILYGCVV